jgi:hypothetical protein
MIRQSTWMDVYHNEFNMTPKALDEPDYLVRMHMGTHLGPATPTVPFDLHLSDHCLELMRIDMMCNIDVTPYFNSHHKCRNFKKIQEWVVDHTVIP